MHYTHRYTGYGPIVAGDDGISYVTLRENSDAANKAKSLPESLPLLQPGPRVTLSGAARPSPAKIASASCEVVIEPRPEGQAAWLVRVPAGQSVPAPAGAHEAGQFRLVFRGALKTPETTLPRLGCAFLSGAESRSKIEAGDEDLELVVVQFGFSSKEG